MVGISKKLACLMLPLALLAASCTNDAGEGNGEGARASTFDQVMERGTLVAGVRNDIPPFGSLDEDGEPVGFDIDVVAYLADQLGVDLELRQVSAETRITELQNGNIDVSASALAITVERIEAIDFSIPYFKSGSALLVKQGSGIGGADDLAGARVAAIQGTFWGDLLRERQPDADIVSFQEYPQAAQALRNDQVDAVISGDDVLFGLQDVDPSFERVILDDFPVYDSALGIPRDDSRWKNAIDLALLEMWNSGVYAEVYRRHWKDDPPEFTVSIFPDWI